MIKTNFPLQFQYNIEERTYENEEKYQLGDYKLIRSYILRTNITKVMWQTERRITN